MAPGGDFQALAKEYSDAGTREAGGDLGDLEAGDLSPVLEKTALETPVGAVSEPLETDYGFHLLQESDIQIRPKYKDRYHVEGT